MFILLFFVKCYQGTTPFIGTQCVGGGEVIVPNVHGFYVRCISSSTLFLFFSSLPVCVHRGVRLFFQLPFVLLLLFFFFFECKVYYFVDCRVLYAFIRMAGISGSVWRCPINDFLFCSDGVYVFDNLWRQFLRRI